MRVVTPEDRARWHRAHKFVRFGITEDRFNQMLEDQGHACAICRELFRDQRICVDHDHAYCPVPLGGHARSCGRCVRGLLCVRCNTWLGWMETYGREVAAYLARMNVT
jgi:Recombination endonuclease VII